jgi:hypothetical protein
VFDGLVQMYEPAENRSDCVAHGREACWIDMMSLTVSAIGSTESASTLERRKAAERALGVIVPIVQTSESEGGEILLSALRYDACRAVKEVACMTESANSMNQAMADVSDIGTEVSALYGLLEEFGVRYPIDLEQVMKEVAEMGKQE